MGKFMPVAGCRDAYTIRLVRCVPSGGSGISHEVLAVLRRASGGSLLAFGLLLVWSEQVGVGVGSDLGGTASHLAQISLSVVIWVGHFEHHTARSDTPCREKPRSGFLHGRSCSLLMSAVCWCGAVNTAVGKPALGGKQILGDVPQFQGCCGVVVKCFLS